MPKSYNEKIESYKRKIQRLERKKHKRRRVVFDDTDDSDPDVNIPESGTVVNTDTMEEAILIPPDRDLQPAVPTVTMDTVAEPAVETVVEPSVDPELLAALGEFSSESPEFGASIHDSLANLWLPILRKGLSKENKENLLKDHLIPDNCKLLEAPKLNAEIAAAISEVVRGRDKKYGAVQQQLGKGITAINRAMDIILKGENKVETLKFLSDGCRILSDLHFFFTKDRIKLVSPGLDKNILHIVQDATSDETLFGNKLSENIKASKAIEKQGQQIKKSINMVKNNIPHNTSARPSTSQGNWQGPPRFSLNRGGGRGGNRKMSTTGPITRRPYLSSTTQTQSAIQNKPRAPARHQ